MASFDLVVGDHVRYNMQYHMDKGFYWSFGVNSMFNDFNQEIDFNLIRSNFQIVDDPNIGEINLDVTDLTNQIYFQTVSREEFAISLGLEHKLLRYSTRTINNLPIADPEAIRPTIDGRTFFENSNYFSTYGTLTYDSYDAVSYTHLTLPTILLV